MQDAFILSACRTPIGSFGGALKEYTAVDLGTVVAKEAIVRAGLSPGNIDETIVGCVYTACQGQNIARQVAIHAGLPLSSQAFTVNKVCSSGMKAIIMAAQAVQLEYHDTVLAIGTESMSNAVFAIRREEMGSQTPNFLDTLFVDGLMDTFTKKKMGAIADEVARIYKISREEQDSYAISSYERAAKAWENGSFLDEVVPVLSNDGFCVIDEDQEYKKLNTQKVPHLKPSFVPDTGTITAANASSISDGAAALIVASGKYLMDLGSTPMAQILGYTEAGESPSAFTLAPVTAVHKLLKKLDISIDEVDLWEVNEAFSVNAIIFAKNLGIERSRVNVRGGAVAIGHPIGASGARIVVTLLHALQKDQIGIATVCNGGGEAAAIAVKRIQ